MRGRVEPSCRIDCQLIMGLFTYIYTSTIVDGGGLIARERVLALATAPAAAGGRGLPSPSEDERAGLWYRRCQRRSGCCCTES